jgi:PPOX class probable F420-dependent enzyme
VLAVAATPADLTAEALEFLTERHLATLTTTRADGTAHVVPVGFTWDPEAGIARVITRDRSQKGLNAARGGRAAVCQLEGGRWLTLEGPVDVVDDPESVRDGERRYAARYRTPRENPQRVVVRIHVDRVMGSAAFRGTP